jgi:hypothetical protein
MSDTKADEQPASYLAPFNPTKGETIDHVLEHMNLKPTDILFDLGCGNAALLIRAVQLIEGLRCVGIEYEKKWTDRAMENILKLDPSVRERIEIRTGDLLEIGDRPSCEAEGSSIGTLCRDLTIFDATSIYVYLLPKGIVKVKEQILDKVVQTIVDKSVKEKRSIQVVTYIFSIKGWEPTVVGKSGKSQSPIYVYRFPEAINN